MLHCKGVHHGLFFKDPSEKLSSEERRLLKERKQTLCEMAKTAIRDDDLGLLTSCNTLINQINKVLSSDYLANVDMNSLLDAREKKYSTTSEKVSPPSLPRRP